jgi:hypothetical protein
LIPNFLECNGQVVADGGSPLDGMALPDLNGAGGVGNKRFLMGSSTSGTTGGTDQHVHYLTGGGTLTAPGAATHNISGVFHLPPYYEVVWVIRIK